MDAIDIKCPNCSTKSTVVEEKLIYSSGKSSEKAYCPKCSSVIHQNDTEGWFYVKVTNDSKMQDKECWFPMP